MGQKLFGWDLACGYVGEERLLCEVLLVDDAGLGLEHAPCLTAFDAEHEQLTRERTILDLSVLFVLDVDAEVRNEGEVFGQEIAPVDNILLRDAYQHVVQMDELLRLLGLDLLEEV